MEIVEMMVIFLWLIIGGIICQHRHSDATDSKRVAAAAAACGGGPPLPPHHRVHLSATPSMLSGR
jgi:hypothetical protein